jgi:hypothetical protein
MESVAGFVLLAIALVFAVAMIAAFVLAITTEVPPADRKLPPHKWHRF